MDDLNDLEPEPYGPVTHSNKSSELFKKVEEKLSWSQPADIDPECEHYENAMGSLALAEKYGLQVEVFCTAMDYFRKNKLTISEAFLAAQWDWDVCVPLSELFEEEKESPEEIEEFNNHMRSLNKDE